MSSDAIIRPSEPLIATNMVTDKRIKFWRVPDLRNLELLSARQERSFPRRMHDRFEISVIESGAERLWYRGSTYTASAGSVVVVSPGEAHAAQATDETGWSYRAFYPSADVQEGPFRTCCIGRRGQRSLHVDSRRTCRARVLSQQDQRFTPSLAVGTSPEVISPSPTKLVI